MHNTIHRPQFVQQLNPDVIKSHRDDEFDRQLANMKKLDVLSSARATNMQAASGRFKEIDQLTLLIEYSQSLMVAYDTILVDKINNHE